jgi:hypothetical protein
MRTFEVTFPGHDPEDSETDHLVKWVKAPDRKALDKALPTFALCFVEVRYLEGRDEQIAPEECDYVVNENGQIVWAAEVA